jgi:hypothetical protein
MNIWKLLGIISTFCKPAVTPAYFKAELLVIGIFFPYNRDVFLEYQFNSSAVQQRKMDGSSGKVSPK